MEYLSSFNLSSTTLMDGYYVISIALGFGVAKLLVEHILLKGLAKAAFVEPAKQTYLNSKSKDPVIITNANRTALKFRATGFRFVLNLVISTVGILSAYNSPWFWDSKQWFVDGPLAELSIYNRAHYMVDAGAYLFQLTAMHFEPLQSDYWMMLIHHVVTLTLIFVSYQMRQTRVGEVVMLLHDVCDPPLELAKLFVYLDYNILKDLCFQLFAVLFVLCRDLAFPYLVLRGIILDAYLTDGSRLPHAYECLFFLSILQVLNLIWTYMIYKSATQPKLKDVRDLGEE